MIISVQFISAEIKLLYESTMTLKTQAHYGIVYSDFSEACVWTVWSEGLISYSWLNTDINKDQGCCLKEAIEKQHCNTGRSVFTQHIWQTLALFNCNIKVLKSLWKQHNHFPMSGSNAYIYIHIYRYIRFIIYSIFIFIFSKLTMYCYWLIYLSQPADTLVLMLK